MNFLLKVEGYLSGEPGDYYPTEKGKQFVVEKGNDNGYGGYAFRGWNWLEWDESILDELDVSMEYKCYIREKTTEERRNDSSSGKIFLGALVLAGYGIYKVVTNFTKKK